MSRNFGMKMLRTTLFPYTTLFRPPSLTLGLSRAWKPQRGHERRLEGVGCRPMLGSDSAGEIQSYFESDTGFCARSEEHTSELQSRGQLVCRLLLDKKNVHGVLNPT